MTLVVVDASVLGAWALPDEDGEEADRMIDAAEALIAPFHLPAGIGNVLLVTLRRNRLSEVQLEQSQADIEALAIEIDLEGQNQIWAAMTLARRHKLTLYDALYLELALRRDLAFATFDADLLRAAGVEGVALL